MKSALLVPLLLLVGGCSRRDAELCDQIIGTWTNDDVFEVTLNPDDSFISKWTRPASKVTYLGTWRVQDGVVVSEITNAIAQGTTNLQVVGTVDRWVIIRADCTDLVWSNDGQTISLKRKK